MVYYRIYEYIENRTGLGFGQNGARWNHHGTPLIYAASSVALAMMEMLSIKGSAVTQGKWILAHIDVPEELPKLGTQQLPEDWNFRPPTRTTKDFGTHWAERKSSVALQIPSARIPLTAYPAEHNLLINPLHPEFAVFVKLIKDEEIPFYVEGK